MPETAPADLSQPGGQLLANLLLFGRLLRGLGLDVNPGRMMDLVQALSHIDLGRRDEFYHATRSLLVHDRADLVLFDRAFDLFWRRPVEGWDVDAVAAGDAPRPAAPQVAAAAPAERSITAPIDERADGRPPVLEVAMTYSQQERLRHKDFADCSPAELATIRQLIRSLDWELGRRRSRRRRPGDGRAMDLRRTLRRSLPLGGEIMAWSYRRPRLKPRPLVILADISGSMERYTRLLLHFVYSLSEGLERPVESFVFGTRLTRITRQLAGRDVERAMREVAQTVPDWSGGTRMGEALRRFNFDWGRRVLGRGAVVLLISDGWDRGDPALLAGEMARLQRSAHRLIWLNPLLGAADYEPLTRGMQAALPFVDDFLPVHNFASLEALAGRLARLEPRRPIRRQSGQRPLRGPADSYV